MKKYQHFINGKWTDPDSGEWFDSENPYTGEVWAQIARGNAVDVDKAVKAAKDAFENGWGTSSPTYRGKLMNKLAELLKEMQKGLASWRYRIMASCWQRWAAKPVILVNGIAISGAGR